MVNTRKAVLLLLVLLVVSAVRAQTVVNITSGKFVPKNINITVGEEVSWNNLENRQHVLATKGPYFYEIKSPLLQQGYSYSHVFNKAAKFYYYDALYGYEGTVTVLNKTKAEEEPKAETKQEQSEQEKQQLPNPASVYCVEQGGQSEIRTAADGSQSGYCKLPDGTECDEWAYFRRECPKKEETEPLPENKKEEGNTTLLIVLSLLITLIGILSIIKIRKMRQKNAARTVSVKEAPVKVVPEKKKRRKRSRK